MEPKDTVVCGSCGKPWTPTPEHPTMELNLCPECQDRIEKSVYGDKKPEIDEDLLRS